LLSRLTFQHDLVVHSKAFAERHDRIVLQFEPEAFGGNSVLVDRNLRKTFDERPFR